MTSMACWDSPIWDSSRFLSTSKMGCSVGSDRQNQEITFASRLPVDIVLQDFLQSMLIDSLTLSTFPPPRRRRLLKVPPRSAEERRRRKNSPTAGRNTWTVKRVPGDRGI